MALSVPPARRRSRRLRIILIAAGVLFFLVVSAILARWFSTENAERDDILTVLVAQVRGDPARMVAGMPGCAQKPTCVATARANAAELKRPGSVHILNLSSPTAYALSKAFGLTRVAWSVPARLPVVQCASVQRTGNIITGEHVKVLTLSRPIGNTADCH
ncbi:MAG TPA: hypothetical protein VHX88_18090 [Solirubrobacteraceae bacterium]|jgi:hypothetical protein|nr:hypothetical protein [Solirubrobacteraceae bacterium]